MTRLPIGLVFFLGAALGSPAEARETEPSLEPLWQLEGLSDPESILPVVDGSFAYVSNVAGEGGVKDGNGYISRISLDGRLLEQRWATGLHAPKGMALRDGVLFVADIDAIVEVDAETGRTGRRHSAPDARFLNDVAVSPDGAILASDSAGARIYALVGDRVEVWASDPRLQSINGLLPEPERLVITTMAGVVLAMDWRTKAIDLLSVGVGDGDGVAALPDRSYIVGEWPGRLFHIDRTGRRTVLIDHREAGVYQNDFALVGDTLLVPNMKPGRISAWRVEGAGFGR